MESLVKIESSLIHAIESSFDGKNLPMPFLREIFLIKTHVAGTSYLDLKETEANLTVGDKMIFVREPNNTHDKKAIKIVDINGSKLGYIPRDKNEILANLMDAGKVIFGQLVHKAWHEEWLQIIVKVYMKD
ncbi:HIRAN domain-containing protein [Candidatus Kapaibacterium sp.]